MHLGNTLQAQSMLTQPSLQSWALICWRTLAWPGQQQVHRGFPEHFIIYCAWPGADGTNDHDDDDVSYVYQVLAACLALLQAPGMDYVIKSSQQPCL